MSGLETLAAVGGLIGSGVSAVGQIAAGQQQKAMADYQAQQLDQQAKDRMAVATRDAEQEAKKKDALLSRQTALAASSGGGVQNQSVLKLLEDTEAQGTFNANSAIYGGQSDASGLRSQAAVSRAEGKAAQTGSYLGAAGTLISGFGSAYRTKYGR